MKYSPYWRTAEIFLTSVICESITEISKPWAKSGRLYWNTATPICLRVHQGCLHMTPEWSNCSRHCLVCETHSIHYLVPYRACCLSLCNRDRLHVNILFVKEMEQRFCEVIYCEDSWMRVTEIPNIINFIIYQLQKLKMSFTIQSTGKRLVLVTHTHKSMSLNSKIIFWGSIYNLSGH